MSNDNSSNNPPADVSRNRRGSVTSAAFTNLFQRSNSTTAGTTVFPGAVTTAAINDQRRRLSISTLGLSGSSPATAAPFTLRRGSISTNNSDSIDENAIDEEDTTSRTAPTTPFTRRMSFGAQAMRTLRTPGGTSPGSSNGRPAPPQRRGSSFRGSNSPPTPPSSAASSAANTWSKSTSQASNATNPRAASDLIPSAARLDQGFNWSEQLRSRAESSVATGSRPSFSFASGLNSSPPRGLGVVGVGGGGGGAGPTPGSSAHHDRAKSVPDMPAPPAQAPKPRPPPQKPDHFQERILKGDFYMD